MLRGLLIQRPDGPPKCYESHQEIKFVVVVVGRHVGSHLLPKQASSKDLPLVLIKEII